MNLSNIIALNDYPQTPYQEDTMMNTLKFRWIHAQCYQFILPNGKCLLTDPFFPQEEKAWVRENTPFLDIEDLGEIDYITINHSHFDHVQSLPKIFKHSSPIVICDRIFARELSAAYGIQEFNIFPFVQGQQYHFEDFYLETYIGKHGNLKMVCDLNGNEFKDEYNPAIGKLNSYGSLFNTNFLFRLLTNFTIGFAAGVNLDNLKESWKNGGGPNLLLRQRMRKETPKEFAEECESIGGQLVLPMHHDACCKENEDMNLFCKNVNEIFISHQAPMRMFNPKRLKWYTINLNISVEEEMI